MMYSLLAGVTGWALSAGNYALMASGTLVNNAVFRTDATAAGLRYVRTDVSNAASGSVVVNGDDLTTLSPRALRVARRRIGTGFSMLGK